MKAKASRGGLFTTWVDCPHCGERIDFDAATHRQPLGRNTSLVTHACPACDRAFAVDPHARQDAAGIVFIALIAAVGLQWLVVTFLEPPRWLLLCLLPLPALVLFSQWKVLQWILEPRR